MKKIDIAAFKQARDQQSANTQTAYRSKMGSFFLTLLGVKFRRGYLAARFSLPNATPMSDSHRVKLILTYDILPNVQDTYFQFMLGEVVPTLQSLGLIMGGAWHTAYGEYPMRLVEFIGDDLDRVESILASATWARLEKRLLTYVINYRYKIVPLRIDQFQF